jgi:hypothetical protein
MYKIFNYSSIMFGLLAIILCGLSLLAVLPQGYFLAVLFSIPGMIAGLLALYLNMKHGYVSTLKCIGFWGMTMSSLPIVIFLIILISYNANH